MVLYGDTRLPLRFWDKVSPEPNSGCWLWTGSVAPGGYGQFWLGKLWRANRLAVHALVAPFDDRLYICHRCDNPYCVNPAHLYAGTQFDNMRDMNSRKRRVRRYRKPICSRGHPRTPDNLIGNECRECRRLRQRVEYFKERKQA